jgi:transcriptional regulator with XRE-family HTH domain
VATIVPRQNLTQQTVEKLCADLTLGERIRYARKTAGLTLDGLGAAVGTTRQHLIRLEQNKHAPKPALASRIAEATGVPIELFAHEKAEPQTLSVLIDLAVDKALEKRLGKLPTDEAA